MAAFALYENALLCQKRMWNITCKWSPTLEFLYWNVRLQLLLLRTSERLNGFLFLSLLKFSVFLYICSFPFLTVSFLLNFTFHSLMLWPFFTFEVLLYLCSQAFSLWMYFFCIYLFLSHSGLLLFLLNLLAFPTPCINLSPHRSPDWIRLRNFEAPPSNWFLPNLITRHWNVKCGTWA